MLGEISKNGIRYFYIIGKERVCQYEIKTVSESQHASLKSMFRRLYREKNGGNRFVRKLAQEHKLDGYFSPDEIKNALKYGKVPQGYDVHHIHPLSLGGTNEESNLCLIEKTLHMYLHAKLLNVAAYNYEANITTLLILPEIPKVVQANDISIFFHLSEIEAIQKEEVIRLRKKEYQRQKKASATQKKHIPVSKKTLMLDVGQLNAAYRRKIRAQQKYAAIEARKEEKRAGVNQSRSYKDSSKYQRSELKCDRNQVRQIIHGKMTKNDSRQYGN